MSIYGDMLFMTDEILPTPIFGETFVLAHITPKVKKIGQEIDDLAEKKNKKRCDECAWKKQYDMLLNDYINYKRRTDSKLIDLKARERVLAFRDLILPILDSFEALRTSKDPAFAYVEPIYAQLYKNLRKETGIKQFGEIYDMFDPELHNAVGVIQNDNFKSDTILNVVRHGYKMDDTVLRPADVVVAK
jgi:molecular chaperone GrpE